MLCAQHLKFQRTLLACLFAALLASFAAPAADAGASSRLSGVERSIIDRFNAIRADAGLPALRASRALSRSADYHSGDMLRANFFAHPSSNGQSMAARVSSFRSAKWIGEVLAYVHGTRKRGQARRVVRMWMKSSAHRATILNRRFRRVGVARRAGKLGRSRVSVFTADFSSAR